MNDGPSQQLAELAGWIVPMHGDPRFLLPPLYTAWAIDPTIALGVFGIAAAYLFGAARARSTPEDRAAHPLPGRQRAAFLAGCVTLLLALGPPIEDWAGLLLTGHMIQHLLLTVLAPPLLLLGLPAWMLRPALRWRPVARVGYLLTRPLVALVASSAVVILWHLPVLYDASLRWQPIHIVQHQMFLVTAFLAWWPIAGQLPEWPRPAPPVQCLYLFGLTFAGGLVGAFITYAEPPLYPYYASVPRMLGIDLKTDQQAAGLTMWVGGSLIYLLVITVVFLRWAAREETADRAAPAARRAAARDRPAG